MKEREGPRFRVINTGFVCVGCGAEVAPLANGGCRNHCPFCLVSLHVDLHPGDRAADCRGLMLPIRAELHPRKGIVIIHRCRACGTIKRNRAATDDPVQSDSFDLILTLMRRPT